MNRIVYIAVSVLLVLGGLIAFVLAVIAFAGAVPADTAVTLYNMIRWFPGYGIAGLLIASLGIILLTFHRLL